MSASIKELDVVVIRAAEGCPDTIGTVVGIRSGLYQIEIADGIVASHFRKEIRCATERELEK